jgi:bacteriocin biosynthesis cyclodehydratase domain-containing protein
MPHITPALPARPWIRDDVPLAWRSDTCVEVGWPPRQARVDGVDHAHVAWLLGLQGDRELAQAIAHGTEHGLRTGTMRRLLRTGVQSGLVDDASVMPESLRDAPSYVRDLVAGDLAAARHVHGATPRTRSLMDQRRSAEVAIQGTGAVADVVALVLTAAGVGNVVQDRATHSASKRHRRGAAERACHVLCDASHPDAAADPEAMALDIPHLAVTATGARAVIGPLVIPGRTSCLRCRDLHLADADPAWPRIAVQWSTRQPGPVAAGLAHLSGAWAALQALELVDAGSRDALLPTMDAALIVTLPDAGIRREARPPHPLCGCLWPETGSGGAPRSRREA